MLPIIAEMDELRMKCLIGCERQSFSKINNPSHFASVTSRKIETLCLEASVSRMHPALSGYL